MGLKFNFNISLKPKRQTRSPSNISYSVIESKVEGLIKADYSSGTIMVDAPNTQKGTYYAY